MKVLAVVLLAAAVAQAAVVPRLVSKIRTKPVLPTAPVPSSPRIINGNQATRGQFPYQVALEIDNMYFCGGSLISTSWVLTAGHCVEDGREWVIYLGAQNVNANDEPGREIVTSNNGILHEDYDSFTLDNDVGVVQLPNAITPTEYIQVVALPSRSQAGDTFEGETLRVSGWGLTSDSATSISPQLNYVDLTVISNSECEDVYGSLLSSVLCTDGTSVNICSGDSGGPLVQINGNTVTEIGVVSFGASAGCEEGYPSGFSRTTAFLDWISTNTGIQIN